MDFAMQGAWTKWDMSFDFSLSPPKLLSILLNATQMTLPTPDRLRVWNVVPISMCKLCSHPNCSHFHILCNFHSLFTTRDMNGDMTVFCAPLHVLSITGSMNKTCVSLGLPPFHPSGSFLRVPNYPLSAGILHALVFFHVQMTGNSSLTTLPTQ